MIELGLGKQPAAGDLGARHRALRHHFVDLAFLEAEVAGGFGRREKLHHITCTRMHIFLSWQTSPKKTSQSAVKIKMGEMQKPADKKIMQHFDDETTSKYRLFSCVRLADTCTEKIYFSAPRSNSVCQTPHRSPNRLSLQQKMP